MKRKLIVILTMMIIIALLAACSKTKTEDLVDKNDIELKVKDFTKTFLTNTPITFIDQDCLFIFETGTVIFEKKFFSSEEEELLDTVITFLRDIWDTAEIDEINWGDFIISDLKNSGEPSYSRKAEVVFPETTIESEGTTSSQSMEVILSMRKKITNKNWYIVSIKIKLL